MTKENLIGERIKELRKSKGLTQEELGKIIGVQKSAVLKYENGSVQNLKRTTIAKLADFFKVAPYYLMGFDSDEKEDDVISKYNLTPDELSEYNRIMEMNLLMFNNRKISKDDKEKLEKTLKEIFVKSLLLKREEENK